MSPMLGSIKAGQEIGNRMNLAGADGGTFNFGSMPVVSSSIGLDTYVSRHVYDDGFHKGFRTWEIWSRTSEIPLQANLVLPRFR